jgi:hypothetical protein
MEASEWVFINISWRAEILGFDFKTGYSAKPNQILIHRHFSSRIWGDCPFSDGFWNLARLRMPETSPTLQNRL